MGKNKRGKIKNIKEEGSSSKQGYLEKYMKKNKEKVKKIAISTILILILIILLIITYKQYESYKYTKELKQVQSQYTGKQKECVVVGTSNSYIYLTRTDENKEAIKDSTWKVTTPNGKEKGRFTTNRNGSGGLVGLEYGEYYVEEISVPEGFTKMENKYKVIISEHDTSYTINATESPNKGTLFMVVLDSEGNPVEGINYVVYNSQKQKVITITTNKKGLAGVENMADGVYYVKEENEESKEYSVYIKDSSTERIDIEYQKPNE